MNTKVKHINKVHQIFTWKPLKGENHKMSYLYKWISLHSKVVQHHRGFNLVNNIISNDGVYNTLYTGSSLLGSMSSLAPPCHPYIIGYKLLGHQVQPCSTLPPFTNDEYKDFNCWIVTYHDFFHNTDSFLTCIKQSNDCLMQCTLQQQ